MTEITRRILLRSIGAASVLSFAGLPARAEGGTLRIGVLQPQQGDCAQWGIPITRAVEMWAEELTGAEGFTAGDGNTYKLEVLAYDNNCYAAGDELKAARRAILDDGCTFLLQTYTPSARQAIGPLTNESKALVTSYGAGFIGSEFPFLLGAQTGQPMGNMLTISHIIERHPDAMKVAILTGDTSFAKAARAYVQAGCAAHADRIQIVYDESYGASAVNDMLGLLAPLADSAPDIVYEMGFAPGQKATMVATLEQLGFTGIYGSESWEANFLEQAGVLQTTAGRLFSGPSVDAQEPTFSPRAHDFYKRYVEKYGAAEWAPWASSTYAAVMAFEVAFKAAPAMDPETVMNTLYAMETVDHPLFGPSKWGGAEIFGVNHHLYTPQPVYGVGADGTAVIDGVVDTFGWWEKNKAAALPVLAAGGQVYAA